MAKIIITGDSVSVISSLTLEEIKTIAKYRPQALNLYETNGEEKSLVFAISTGAPRMSSYGVSFSAETTEGNAVMTEIFAGVSVDKIKDAVAEKYGVGILNLRKLELQIPEILEAVKNEREEIKSSIEVQ